jgi:predicted GIY-YIG superfamily endonuclease
MLRDKLLARLATMGDAPDHQVLAAEVLGIRGAPPALAKRLVAQALVVEDRREIWRQAGERICRQAPPTPGVYVLKDADGRPLYVGKAVHLRRRLRTHFAERRWRALKPEMSRAAGAEWREVGSEIEALLREAELIHILQPPVNVQVGAPDLDARAVPRTLLRDVIVVQPSIEPDSIELICAAIDGGWMIQRTRRNGADLVVHTRRVLKFFNAASAKPGPVDRARSAMQSPRLAPLVFSWLADRGSSATRLDPHDSPSATELRRRLAALFADDRLFAERLDQR